MKSLIHMINAAVFCIATMVQLIPVKGADNNTTNEKCCGDFGCFPLGAPWSTPTRPVQPPKCPDECPVEFYMLSKKNKDRNVTISGWPIKSLKNATFDGNKTTVFFVHGWTVPSKRDENNQKLGKSFLENFDVNFIFVDYSACASDPYLQAISNARTIAAQAIRFIKYLIQNHGASPSRIHVIGISLGAQITGYIGKGMPGLWRLTGLDPAAPLFEGYGKEVELSSDDANFVEVGHTETFRFIGFGVRQPKGNVDYYFNGEVNERLLQPGCASETFNTTIQDFIKGSYKISAGIQSYLLCNHARALLYYNEAIINNNCTFWGLKLSTPINTITEITDKIFATNTTSLESCSLDTCSPWGINAIHYPATGAFFVRTNSTEPFCVDEPEVDKKMKKLLDNYEEDNKKNDKGS